MMAETTVARTAAGKGRPTVVMKAPWLVDCWAGAKDSQTADMKAVSTADRRALRWVAWWADD
jgi:hypothetical protein